MAKNLCAKTVKRENAYEVWQTPDRSWTWYCLKKWQIDDNKPGARWFCDVVTPHCPDGELGDVFVSDIKSHARRIGGTLPAPPKVKDRPEPGKIYALTGPNSISLGRSWADSEVKEPPKPADPTAAVTSAERPLFERWLGAGNPKTVTRVVRQSKRAYDFKVEGTTDWDIVKDVGFRAWFPLSCIADMTNWTAPTIANQTDYPDMAGSGDWSGVRDSSRDTIWKIFERFVANR